MLFGICWGEYQDWITTPRKHRTRRKLSPFEAKPILVITEDSDEQEAVFFHEVPVGGRLRLFGSAHTNIHHLTRQQRTQYLAIATPGQLLSTPPTNYRRWWNNSCGEVEEGGQHQAVMDGTDRVAAAALLDHAHSPGPTGSGST